MKVSCGFLRKQARTALVLAVFLAACDSGEGPNPGVENALDDTNHNTDYSIRVRNNTSQKLIAFKGDLVASKIIGSIPAHANDHGLRNDPALFGNNEEFPLILLTEKQFNENTNNWDKLRETPFTRVYVFYNKSGDNSAVYEIAKGLGGNNKLTIINTSTTLNVELRLNGVAGETIGYAPAGMQKTTLYLNDDDYIIFPVFKRYDRLHDVVDTVYPKNDRNLPWSQSYGLGDIGNGRIIDDVEMNLATLLSGLNMTSGVAWVIVNNQTIGAIRFLEGSTPRKTLSGRQNLPESEKITFQFDMVKIGNNYAESLQVSNWKFGTAGYEVPLTNSGDNIPRGPITLLRDKMYTVTVTGNQNNGGFKATIDDGVDIDVSDFTLPPA